MRNKGISQIVVRLIMFWIFVAIAFGSILFYWKAQLSVENNIEDNEVLITRKVIFANILMSSDLFAYTDENGIHRGMFDINKIKKDNEQKLDAKKLFDVYSYKPDKISEKGYTHFVRIDSFESPTDKKATIINTFAEPIIASKLVTSGSLPGDTMEFPIAIRYTQDNIRPGKLYVSLFKSGGLPPS